MASDYTFMSTGFRTGSDQPLDEAFTRKMLALVYTMVKNAANTAATYANHAGKDQVTRDDVIMALKYEARRFLHYDGLEADVATSEQELIDEEAHDSESWETALEKSGDDEKESALQVCPCSVCAGLRDAVSTWDEWAPENEAEAFLRHHFERVVSV